MTMADDKDTGATSAVLAPVPAEVPVVKKQRAPRRSKAEIEATLSTSPTTVKSPTVRKKRAAPVEAAPAVVKTPVAKTAKVTGAKGPGKTKAVSPAKAPAKAPTKSKVTASDGIADLIQLEEENKKLRKALADKLRSENADLRKRLGA
jgi:hypothetical protein